MVAHILPSIPDSKVRGTDMGPIWCRQNAGGREVARHEHDENFEGIPVAKEHKYFVLIGQCSNLVLFQTILVFCSPDRLMYKYNREQECATAHGNK